LNELAGNLLEAPFYTRLRTERQLGYITFATAFPLVNTPVLTGVVQSPVADPDALADAILGEFNQFAEAVGAMDPAQLEDARQSMLNDLDNPPQTQAELSNDIWQAIGLRRPFTDRVQRAETLKRITQAEFVDYLKARLKDPIVLKAYRSEVAVR
jgi:Secreted/periplasmic Zn-dependent peptidases, insulinase-like